MINFNTINQIHDIMTVLNNTKKAVSKEQTPSFNEMVIQASMTPTKQSEVVQTTVTPETKIHNSNICYKCGKPGKYFLNGVWVCEECKDRLKEI